MIVLGFLIASLIIGLVIIYYSIGGDDDKY